MNVKKLLLLIIGSCLVLSGCGKEKSANINNISAMHGSFSINVESYPELAGDADYVFVGKVTEELSVEYRWPITVENEDGSTREETTPYTNYNVQVTENLKGSLNQEQPITITKAGGVSKEGDMYILYENDIMPMVGKSYIFFIYVQEDGSNLSVGPNSTIPLESENTSDVSTRAIQEDVNDIEVIDEIKDAIANEIVGDKERAISKDDTTE